MTDPTTPPSEVADIRRLDALRDYDILDTPPEKGFDDIVELARMTCAAPVALVSLVTGDRQWFKAKAGFAPCETSLDKSVCAHVLGAPDLLVIPDLTLDPRTRENPLVTGEPYLRFYAGAPLQAAGGERLGSLCVIDLAPRPEGLTEPQAGALRALAGQVMTQMDLRRSVAERERILSGQAALIAQQNVLIAAQTAVTRAAGDRNAILDALVADVMEAVPQAEGGVIELREGDELIYRSGRGSLAGHVGLRLPLDGSLSGHCLMTGKPVLCPDVLLDPRVKRDVIAPLGMRSAIYVPVSRGHANIGVLKLQSSRPDAFSGRDLRTATLFAGTIPAGLAEAGEAEARRGMRASEATLRTVMDTLPVGVLIAEAPSGHIVGHNARVAAILGHDVMPTTAGGGPERCVGFHADGRRVGPEDWPLLKLARHGTGEGEIEVDYQRGDGRRAWVGFSGAPMHDADGGLVGSVVVSDIDERKRAELLLEAAKHAAEEANRAKSEFLANMSHELRTPLSAVIGYSEMLQEEMEDLGHENLLPDMRKIEANARHLLGLINDVLDLSKIEAERMETYVEEFSVESVVRDVASTVEALIDKKGNALTLDLRDDLGEARTDVTKLRQCLINLLSNAAKFTEGGRITLSVERTLREGTDWLDFRVTDTGIGMTPEQQARLFERFTQADASTTRKFGGTGLGLSITRAFATMLGGQISVASQEGSGTTFTVTVPARITGTNDEETSTAIDEVADGSATQASGLVLVVDDDPATRDLVARFLERDGFRVAVARDGKEGIERARTLRPRVILLDVTMPRMDGWSVLRTLRGDAELGNTPIIMVTVLDEQSLAFSLGATDYLQKPVDWDELHGVMDRFRPQIHEGPLLVIHDDADTRERMSTRLSREGWRVTTAENGRIGLAAVAAERPSLILLDLMMPEMDGFAFLNALRARPGCGSIPVVVLTAKDVDGDDRRRLAGQADRVLMKGRVGLDDLPDLLRPLVASSPTD
ncbi:response regulator [Methylobacterium sp. E-065]|uniref:response regulator n=1 Tax=Methylobacterium sp. E-065 TaxID=2836583 RepID=UPI001FB8E0DB|nr:response regulator [Methylobacterium sp. E-065]MCJ2021879.1 response regulator [Methylobacterium sp. E-065]